MTGTSELVLKLACELACELVLELLVDSTRIKNIPKVILVPSVSSVNSGWVFIMALS